MEPSSKSLEVESISGAASIGCPAGPEAFLLKVELPNEFEDVDLEGPKGALLLPAIAASTGAGSVTPLFGVEKDTGSLVSDTGFVSRAWASGWSITC